MAADTEIANQALGHLGCAKEIQSLTTDKSQEAQACRRFYPTVRDAVLRDFPWPFAMKNLALALVATNPTQEWSYSYRYPSDCLMFRKILSGIRTDAANTRVPYRILSDDVGGLIYTDQATAMGEYTRQVTDPQRFPSDFVQAFSLGLASLIAPRVTGGDPFKMGERAMQMYAFFLSKAQKNAINEEQADMQRESEFVRIRGGSDSMQKTFLGQLIQNFPAQDL